MSLTYPFIIGCLRVLNEGYNSFGIACFANDHEPPHCLGYEEGEGYLVDDFDIPCGRGENI